MAIIAPTRSAVAEARFLFLISIGTLRLRSGQAHELELVPFPVFRRRRTPGQQQVPHWAFGPVRKDKVIFRCALRGAEAPLFHGGAGGGRDFVEFTARPKSKAKSKVADKSVRSTRARAGLYRRVQ